jgi:OOP family OmpA-OmpF porin
MIAWDADYKESDSDGWSYSESADGTDPFYGVGAEYEINQIIMRAEYERYEISDSGEDFEIDLMSASLGYRF